MSAIVTNSTREAIGEMLNQESERIESLTLTTATFPKRGKGQKGKTFTAQVFGIVTSEKDDDGTIDISVDTSKITTVEHEAAILKAAEAAGFNTAQMLVRGFNEMSKACESSISSKAGLYYSSRCKNDANRKACVQQVLGMMAGGLSFELATSIIDEKVLPNLK